MFENGEPGAGAPSPQPPEVLKWSAFAPGTSPWDQLSTQLRQRAGSKSRPPQCQLEGSRLLGQSLNPRDGPGGPRGAASEGQRQAAHRAPQRPRRCHSLAAAGRQWVAVVQDFSFFNECRIQWQRSNTFRTARTSREAEAARAEVIAAVRDRHASRLVRAFNVWHGRGGHDPADQVHVDAVRILVEWQEMVEHCFAGGTLLSVSVSEFCEHPLAPSKQICGPRLLDVVKGWNFSRGDATYLFLSQLASQYKEGLAALSDAVRGMRVEDIRAVLQAWSFNRDEDRRYLDAKQDLERWGSQYKDLILRLNEAIVARDIPRVQMYLSSWNFDREADANVSSAVELVKLYQERSRELQEALDDTDLVRVHKALKHWMFSKEDALYRSAVSFDELWGRQYAERVRADLGQAVEVRHMAQVRKHLEQWTLADPDRDETHRAALHFESEWGPVYDGLCSQLCAAMATSDMPKDERQGVMSEVLASWSFSREDEIYIQARNLLSGLLLLQWMWQSSPCSAAGLRVVCLLDQSTSIGDYEFDNELKPAVKELAKRLNKVAETDAPVRWRFAVFPGQRDPDGIKSDCQDICGAWVSLEGATSSLDVFEYDGGSTPMHGALDLASQMLEQLDEAGPAKELVIVFTDGEPNDKDAAILASRRLKARPALMLHGVGIGDGILMSNLEQITDQQCTRMAMHGLQKSLSEWADTALNVFS